MMFKKNLTVIICSVPRSGSTLLARSLEATELFGNPREYFNEVLHPDYKKIQDKYIVDYMQDVYLKTRSNNGNWGFKIHYPDMKKLIFRIPKKYNVQCFKSLIKTFFPISKIIFISRKNKIRQAISGVIAQQTHVFNIESLMEFDSFQHAQRLIYRSNNIKRGIINYLRQEQRWVRTFKGERIKYKTIWYEDYCKNYRMKMMNILKYLEYEDKVDSTLFKNPLLHRLSNQVNDQWYAHYVRRHTKLKLFYKLISNFNFQKILRPSNDVFS